MDRNSETFLVEGARSIEVALDVRWRLRSLLLSESRAATMADACRRAEAAGAEVFVAENSVLYAVTGFAVHRGALALAERPPALDPSAVWERPGPVLVAEGVDDHENLGAMFRSCAAFAAAGVLLDPMAADPLYRRAVRVSLGAVMRVPFARLTDWPDGVATMGRPLIALTPSATRSLEEVAQTMTGGPFALMVGSEAQGLSPSALACADELARIPMASGIDSLNVAAAAAIGLYALTCRG